MLRIETFDNKSGGNAFFKAVTHPLAAAAAPELLRRLGEGRSAVYDVEGQVDALAELYDLSRPRYRRQLRPGRDGCRQACAWPPGAAGDGA